MAQLEEKLSAILNDPQTMGKIMSIAQSLGGGQGDGPAQGPAPEPAQTSPPPPGPELDPRVMEAGMRALAAWQEPPDRRGALLQALRPFLREERRGKVDRAVQVTRLTRVVRAVLDGLQGGEGDV